MPYPFPSPNSRLPWLTAALFVLYLLLIVIGYARWRREFRAARPEPA